MRIRHWLATGLLAWACCAGAASYAVVDAVQAPVWLERGSLRQPLVPGMELRNHDWLVTGPEARAVIHLADGSAVKVGEKASLRLNALGRRSGGVYTAAVDIATGAFRLTTDTFRRFHSQRAINVRVGAMTIGIRGTDVWGRSDAQRDLVCLLEGRVIVDHPDVEPEELAEPLQFYSAAKGELPGPIATVEPQQLEAWALQTELQAGRGTLRRGGRWVVVLATVDSQAEALGVYDRLVGLGYGPRIRPFENGPGQYRYELRIGHIQNGTEAWILADRLGRELGLEAPRAVKR